MGVEGRVCWAAIFVCFPSCQQREACLLKLLHSPAKTRLYEVAFYSSFHVCFRLVLHYLSANQQKIIYECKVLYEQYEDSVNMQRSDGLSPSWHKPSDHLLTLECLPNRLPVKSLHPLQRCQADGNLCLLDTKAIKESPLLGRTQLLQQLLACKA